MTRRDKVLVKHRGAIRAAAARRRARAIAVVGSVARGEDTADSDYDFMVEFEDGISLFDVARLQAELADLLGEPVDVVPLSCVKPTHRGMVRDAILL